jgi:hypothetical protein
LGSSGGFSGKKVRLEMNLCTIYICRDNKKPLGGYKMKP